MKYLPFENITYRTQLPVEEVIERLRKNLEHKKFDPKPHIKRKAYEGYVLRKTFHINSTKVSEPVVMGKIEEDSTGTTINLRIVLSIFQAVFFAMFLAIFLALPVFFTVKIFLPERIITFILFFVLIVLFVLIFGYLPSLYLFKYNSKIIKKHLVELFEAEIKTS